MSVSMMDRVTDWRIGAVATGSAVAAYGLWRWWTNPVTLAAGQRQAVIAAIGTATPAFAGTNDQFREAVRLMGYTPESLALLDKIVERAGIDARHTCVATNAPDFVAAMKAGGRARAEAWERGAPAMAVRAAREAIAAWRDGSAQDVTHVVVHSCTGFAAPGIDYALITQLGLPTSTRKIPVHFAGCFGGFTTLYVAKQIVEADPTGRAVVLVACSEACTAHMSADPRPELIVGNTIFADGAGAAIVTSAGFVGARARAAQPAPAATPDELPTKGTGVALGGPGWAWGLGTMTSEIIPDSGESMTWKNSAEPGRYDMWLSRDIPKVLSGTFASQGFSLLRRVGVANPFTCAWAIHPGGAAILKAFREAFTVMRLKGEGLECSADVLRANGNMSSATIFFVLQRVLGTTERSEVFTAGFGPGLTVELGRVHRVQLGKAAAAPPAAEATAALAGVSAAVEPPARSVSPSGSDISTASSQTASEMGPISLAGDPTPAEA